MVIGTKKFTKMQLKIIHILLDIHGHSLNEMSNMLKKGDGNLKRSLKDLESKKLIYNGEPRIPEEAKTAHKETPYYLYIGLEIIELIMEQERLEYELKHKRLKPLIGPFSNIPFLSYLAGSKYFESILLGYNEEGIINCFMEAGALSRDDVLSLIEWHKDKYENPDDYYWHSLKS